MLTRRAIALSLLSLPLAGCSGAQPVTSARPLSRGSDPGLVPQATSGWQGWVASFRGRALSQGIPAQTFDAAFRGQGYLSGVVERDRNQTEFRRSFEDYLNLVANETRVAEGRAAFARNRGALGAIETRYGVPGQIVAAIWGVESRYGTRRGDIPVISSTSTLAFDGRRGRFFEQQLIAALKILQNGDITPARMVGSWAGAMGHTQFIPTSFEAYAVDFTGDGRRDIWSDDPSDALASTAAYLSRSGWQRGAAWSDEAQGGDLRPDAGGPAFRTGPNFRVIKRYNNSDSYALAVGYLAHRIAGGGPLGTAFGPDRNGLTQDQRIEIQRGLNAAGFDVGTPDGVVGSGTRAAIEQFQRSRGLAVTGDPSIELLRALR